MSGTPDRRRARALAHEAQARGDGTGWFEQLYREAAGDPAAIPWADLTPNPLLVEWLRAHSPAPGTRALVVGCGLGDDARELLRAGLAVSAFDLSPTAIEWCRRRHAGLAIDWRAHDLLTPPPQDWAAAFGLVVEAYTLQSLPASLRDRAAAGIPAFLRPGGTLLAICRGRPDGTPDLDGPPWPLTPGALRGWFGAAGLVEQELRERPDTQEDPPVLRLVGSWRRG